MKRTDSITAAQAAIDANTEAMGLSFEPSEKPQCEVWHLMVSLLEWSEANRVDLFTELREARRYLAEDARR